MSILSTIQQQITDRLSADPFFANVPILTERIKDLQNEISIALGPLAAGTTGKSGLVAAVLTPTANVNSSDVFGPFFDDIRITVRVLENVTQNQDPTTGTGIPAASAAEEICNQLHQYVPDSANGPVVARKPTVSLVEDPTNLIYHCRFRTSGGPRTVPPQLPPPVITDTSGSITMTCATAGAAVFYTLDGSNPAPRNPSAVLYSAAFTPASGVTVKARAFLAGYLTSDTSAATA